jgi:exodeoxyribonuclease V beta subunit
VTTGRSFTRPELEPREFDVCGPLPTGVTVLEASAGTGKTYTIAALAARYVAEGVPLERLLMVTFTRIATGELRERVRERLVSVEQGLARALAGVLHGGDPVVSLLATGSEQEVSARRERLARAVASFDAATIATTHGFCQEILAGLGITGDLEPDVTFVEDLGDLVADVVDDLYVRRFFRGEAPAFGRAQAAEIARVAIENPGAQIVTGPGTVPEMRGRLAEAVRGEFEQRKLRLSVMTYDDLVMRLRSALAGPRGAATAQHLRRRYEVVLVDEFQDTDPAQWDIMRCAFADTGVTLVLIADPKQAIYAFRGADVYAYLEAAHSAGDRATLGVNWRSDQGLIDAHDALLAGVKLGHEGIAYRQVRSAPAHRAARLSGAPSPAPMRFRVLVREDPGLSLTPAGYVRNASAREHICRDLAAEVVGLLGAHAQVEERAQTGDVTGRHEVRPGHMAVLVRTNRHAAMVRDALDGAGVPAVINGAGSVFGTAAARDWLALLEALERPASSLRAHAAALTPFLGWDAERLARSEDDAWAWEEVHRRLHGWARVLRLRGVAAMLETVTLSEGLPARVLAAEEGERRLTDLRHVGQLLHVALADEQMGVTTLTAWLRTRIAEADSDTADEERSRRLESDAEAVQVLTIHRSKGLEFPIVYLPFLWEPGYIPKEARPVFFHDPAAGDARTIDVALEGPEYEEHRRQNVREQRGEDLRLAYVALTRARHQAVVWWAGSWDSRNSPLGRLLFCRDEEGNIADFGSSTPSDASMVARLQTVAGRAAGCVTVEQSRLAAPASWSPRLPASESLAASTFDRGLDLRWRRTSYSDITAASHEAWVASEPEQPLLSDEPQEAVGVPGGGPAGDHHPAMDIPSPMAAMPFGASVGTFVHRVLEASEFDAPGLDGELSLRIEEVQGRRAVDIGDPAALAAGLRSVLETPLGPVLGDLRLRDVARPDRLDELEFELPLAGGDRPAGELTMARIAGLLREHLGPADPLAGYAERLADPQLRHVVRGYLTGSLDLVIRIPPPPGAPGAGRGDLSGAGPRYAVLDYKTNWLGVPGEPLTVWHYRPEVVAAEMQRSHYGLQALLYTVALHRFLRWRVRGYDPERDLAGVVYLFVRGMTGADTPVIDGSPCGVFGWQPPAALVHELSDALDAGTRR